MLNKNEPLCVAVIGLGFIGLPLSLSYAMHGAKVVGIDVLPALIEDINHGISHHLESYQGQTIGDILREQLDNGQFRATSDYAAASQEVDTYIITVGIPITASGEPNYKPLDSCCHDLSRVLKRGDTVIVRSTVVPGTTEERVKPMLEKSGLQAGTDFHLAYSSERIAEGRAFEEFIHMPLALGGVNEASAVRAQEVLTFVTKAEVTISAIKVVETAKVIENIQRDVNIAMVQEFARFAEKADIDTFELIKVANTHKRVNLLMPGPGVGGYCLPNALYYLQPKARELDVAIDLLETARRINDAVPSMLVDMLENALKERGKQLKDSKIALFGLAMKDFSNDDRISPPHDIARLLLTRGAQVCAWDPAVIHSYNYKVDTMADAVDAADALIYLTAQEEFLALNWRDTVSRMASDAILLDTKNRIPRNLPDGARLLRI